MVDVNTGTELHFYPVSCRNNNESSSEFVGSFKMKEGAKINLKGTDEYDGFTWLQFSEFKKTELAGEINASYGNTHMRFAECEMTGIMKAANYSLVYVSADVLSAGGTMTFDNSYLRAESGSCTVSGTVNTSGMNASASFYGDVTVTATGKLSAANGGSQYLGGALTNQGAISITGNSYLTMENTRYAQYNEGTISIDENSWMNVMGTKLVNTGNITGSGTISLSISSDFTNYDTGLEYVNENPGETGYTPDNYPYYKFKSDPAATVDVTYYKSELINDGGTNTITSIYAEDFPAA